MPSPGTVFQLHDGSTTNHFWIVISREVNGRVLTVNVTDLSHCPDSPCRVNVGDHEAIEKPSVIYYRKAREFFAESLDSELAAGRFIRRLPDCRPEILQRIIEGARIADDLTQRFLIYLA